MAKRSYPPEFRRRVLEQVRSGKPVLSVAKEFDVSRGAIKNWLKQDDIDAGRGEGLTTEERAELTRLRRKVRELEMEKEILKKAAADSMGERNTKPMITSGGVANGGAGAPRLVTERESGALEALESRRIVERYCSRLEKGWRFDIRRSPTTWRDSTCCATAFGISTEP